MKRKTWILVLLVGGALVAVGSAFVVRTMLFRRGSITHAKEMLLHDELFTMRSVIDQYTLDKQRRPSRSRTWFRPGI